MRPTRDPARRHRLPLAVFESTVTTTRLLGTAGTRMRAIVRAAATALAFLAIVVGLVELLGGTIIGITIVVGFGAAVAYGAVVKKWWICALPSGRAALIIGAARLSDLLGGSCSLCTGDEDSGDLPFLILMLVVFPLTIGLFVGVALRRARFREPL